MKRDRIIIAPSVLSADFSQLGEEVRRTEVAGADWLHLDVMDGHFVPNLTFGAPVVASLRKHTKLFFDVHLMVTNPTDLVEPFVNAGAEMLTVHAEVVPHLHRLVQYIKSFGVKAGVALNPATPLSMVEEILPDIDMVLLMTVNPGFGGQKFIENMLPKIERLRKMAVDNGLFYHIQVDGGINAETAKKVVAAGADVLVAGSAVYGSDNLAGAIAALR